jgi:putative flippase GtrA
MTTSSRNEDALKFTAVFVGLIGAWIAALRIIPPTAPAVLLATVAAMGSAVAAGYWSSSLR